MTTTCTSGTCSNDVCCTRTMCPANYVCRFSGYQPKPDLQTVACANSTCVDKDCCRDLCANNVCPEGSKPNGNVYCAGIPCSTTECCSQKTVCPATFLCNRNLGDVRKTGTSLYCQGATCTYEECCCTGGCNYCGTQYKGGCLPGSRLAMNKNCGAATCTADICCEGTCLNFKCPTPNGVVTISENNYILCNNPKLCTEADCCEYYGGD